MDPATLTGRHLRDARLSLNLVFSRWATKMGTVPFMVEQASNITMVVGQANYTIPIGTLAILDPIVIRSSLATPIFPISRGDYQRIPNKTYKGLPVNMFFDRPSLVAYFWPCGEFITDAVGYWRLRRIQDVTAASETADVPYTWYYALVIGLAADLSMTYKPDRYTMLSGLADAALKDAINFDRERAPTSFTIPRI